METKKNSLLRRRVAAKNMSFKDLAVATKLSYQLIMGVVNQSRAVSDMSAYRICAALGAETPEELGISVL